MSPPNGANSSFHDLLKRGRIVRNRILAHAEEDEAAATSIVQGIALPGDNAKVSLAGFSLGREVRTGCWSGGAGQNAALLVVKVEVDLVESALEEGAAQGGDVLGGGRGVLRDGDIDELVVGDVDADLVAVALREVGGLVLGRDDLDLGLGKGTGLVEGLVLRGNVDTGGDVLLHLVDDVMSTVAGKVSMCNGWTGLGFTG